MPKQEANNWHEYSYTFPLEDWMVPPGPEDTRGEMAWYPHSNRFYFRWKKTLSNPDRKVKITERLPYMVEQEHPTHWGIVQQTFETTFYNRSVPESCLPPPYKWVHVTMKQVQRGGPQMDDPLGEYPYYQAIYVTRIPYGRDTCPANSGSGGG